MASTPIPIERLLASEGLTGPAASAGRSLLEAAGLTRAGKQAIAPDKERRARGVLATLVRVCADPRCRAQAAAGRRVEVERSACSVCAGSNNRQAATSLTDLTRAGLRRLVVVGGSPGTKAEVERLFGGAGIELRLIDGTRAMPSDRAASLTAWADLVVVWASTELGHRVSELFMRGPNRSKTVICPKRGVAALCETVTERFARAAA